MRLLDHKEYPNVFIGIWWAIQTVTTVGYGDVTPRSVAGRIVASFVMLEAIALVAIVTAAITSTFVARATHLQDTTAAAENARRRRRVSRAASTSSTIGSTGSRRCCATLGRSRARSVLATRRISRLDLPGADRRVRHPVWTMRFVGSSNSFVSR